MNNNHNKMLKPITVWLNIEDKERVKNQAKDMRETLSSYVKKAVLTRAGVIKE